jgi:hypothetical protein
VIAISRRPFSLDWRALRRGRDDPDGRSLGDHRARQGADRLTHVRAGDRGGRQAMAARPGRRAGRGGRQLVVAGYHQDGPRQVNMQMWNWKGIDVVNATSVTRRCRCRAARGGGGGGERRSIRRRSTRTNIRWSGSASARRTAGPAGRLPARRW